MRSVWDEQRSSHLAYIFTTQKDSIFRSIFDVPVTGKHCLGQNPLRTQLNTGFLKLLLKRMK